MPTVPGSEGLIKDDADAVRVADQIGFPVMIKATAGAHQGKGWELGGAQEGPGGQVLDRGLRRGQTQGGERLARPPTPPPASSSPQPRQIRHAPPGPHPMLSGHAGC